MKAAVLISPGVLEFADLPDPKCPEGGALIKVKACAVCGTDVKMLQYGHRDLAYPRVLGHEMVGEVAKIDRDCKIAEGDLVQVWPGIACGRCRSCGRDEDNRCQEMKILGFNRDGGFAEMLALPPECLPRGLNVLPKGFDPVLVSLAEPLACCINGQAQAKVRSGDVVLIFGAGPIGCLHALLAEHLGAAKIIIVEKLANRIQEIHRQRKADKEAESLGGGAKLGAKRAAGEIGGYARAGMLLAGRCFSRGYLSHTYFKIFTKALLISIKELRVTSGVILGL